MAKTPKVAVIGGAGAVGSVAGNELFRTNKCDVVLIDIEGSPVLGTALDIAQASSYYGVDKQITGSMDYSDMKGSDVVIVTASIPRKEGQSRSDLLATNAGIIQQIGEKIKEYAPDSKIIVVTNPLDVMTYLMFKATGFPRERVMGMAGELDSARLSWFIANDLDIPHAKVRAPVLGTHGDTMVALTEHTTVHGKIISHNVDHHVKRAVSGGAEIIKLRNNKGSAYFAPGACAAKMALAIIGNTKEELFVASFLQGEYGISNVYLGIPAIICKDGIEKIVEYKLSKQRLEQMKKSAEAVKEDMSKI